MIAPTVIMACYSDDSMGVIVLKALTQAGIDAALIPTDQMPVGDIPPFRPGCCRLRSRWGHTSVGVRPSLRAGDFRSGIRSKMRRTLQNRHVGWALRIAPTFA